MDGAGIPGPGPGPLRNQDLSLLGLTPSEVLARFGWYLLAAAVTVYLLVQHLRRRRSQDPQTPQGASLGARREQHLEAARRRMQQELDAKAAIFKEKQKQHEEEKRQQKVETWESMKEGRSYRGGSKSSEEAASSSSSEARKPKTDKRPLRRNDYSPLAGQGGGSCSWRPGRRGPSAGG